MSKLPRLPKASRREHIQGAAPTYAIGYGRPPVHTRFKAGQSGNPKGRPRQQRNVRTVVEATLNQRITIREGNQTRSVTKLDGTILSIVNAALKGDAKAQSTLFALLRSLGMTGEPHEASNREPFTPDDGAVIADYFRRNGSEFQTEKPARNEGRNGRRRAPTNTENES